MRDFLRVTIPVFAAGAVAFWWASRRVSPEVRRARWTKFAIYVVIVHAVLAAAIAGRAAIGALIVAIAAAGVVEIRRASRSLHRDRFWIPVVFAAVAAAAIAFALTARPPLTNPASDPLLRGFEFRAIGPATDRKSTRLNSSHRVKSRMPSSA